MTTSCPLRLFYSSNYIHFNLTTMIKHHMKLIPIKCSTQHVKGRQDENFFMRLNRWAKRNMEMDSLAKKYLQVVQHEAPRRWQQRIHGGGWSVWMCRK